MSRPNAPSPLLSDDENVVVFKLLTDRVQSLSTAVVQLVTASPGKTTWNLVVTGVACFVKDWNRRGFFIQVNRYLGCIFYKAQKMGTRSFKLYPEPKRHYKVS